MAPLTAQVDLHLFFFLNYFHNFVHDSEVEFPTGISTSSLIHRGLIQILFELMPILTFDIIAPRSRGACGWFLG